MKARDLFVLGLAMLVVAVFAGNEARKSLERLDSADNLGEYSGTVDMVFYACSTYRFYGTCYVDFRLFGGPDSGFRYHDSRADYATVRDTISKGRRLTVIYGPCDNLYCWPAEIKASGRVLIGREQSMIDTRDALLLRGGGAILAIVLSIAAFIFALRRA